MSCAGLFFFEFIMKLESLKFLQLQGVDAILLEQTFLSIVFRKFNRSAQLLYDISNELCTGVTHEEDHFIIQARS